MLLRKCQCVFFPIKLLFCYKRQIAGKETITIVLRKVITKSKQMKYFFGVCVCVCIIFIVQNLMWQRQILAIQGAENNCQSE